MSIENENIGCREMTVQEWVDRLPTGHSARAAFSHLLFSLEDMRAQKNAAYAERNQLVALIASLYPSSLERHPEEDLDWEDDWRWVVYINAPNGQWSWHIHDSQVHWFNYLPRFKNRVWDGTTTEQKYEMIARLALEMGADK